jgi:holo-[acyl-carrier protein] synthase
MKALGTGLADGVTWQDFSIATHASGRPELVVTGRAAELATARGIASWQVSLTHTKLLGMASVLALSA